MSSAGRAREWSTEVGKAHEEDCKTCNTLDMLAQVGKKNKDKKKEEYWEMKSPPSGIELGNGTWTLLHTIAGA